MRYSLYVSIVIIFCFSCKKAVQIDPPITGLTSPTVYSSNSTAAAVLTGIYSRMMEGTNSFSGGTFGLDLRLGLAADELKNYNTTDATLSQFYRNSLVNTTNSNFWSDFYKNIYVANAAIEGLTVSQDISPTLKQQLLGEAKFIRAFMHFYAVNLFGDVPLITSSDYRQNALATRTDKGKVYQQIISDLLDAQGLLSSNFVTANGSTTTERTRPNKGAATGLLARVYLFVSNWGDAEKQATTVINNTVLYSLPNLNNVFIKNSNEAIWQLQPVQPTYNTYDANTFILTNTAGSNIQPVALNTPLLSAFEAGDNRRLTWVKDTSFNSVTYSYPYKYKVNINQPVTEYQMVLRLAEQYLIRAEARVELGNTAGALSDINMIRHRAGLSDYLGATDKTSLLTVILHERQVELFTEWGQRWLDLKRTNAIDSVMNNVAPLKGGIWNSNWQLLPIPLSEIQNDPNLIQNGGY